MNFRTLFFIFTATATAEVLLFILIGERIGLGWTLFSVLATAGIGLSLLQAQGFDTLKRIQEKTETGQLPAAEMIEGILLLISAALLLTPGFLTDGIGFLILTKPCRKRLAINILNQSIANSVGGNVRRTQSQSRSYSQFTQTHRRTTTPNAANDEPKYRPMNQSSNEKKDRFSQPSRFDKDKSTNKTNRTGKGGDKPKIIDGEFEKKMSPLNKPFKIGLFW